jgi:hypothetical protein
VNAPKHLTLRNVPAEIMRALDKEKRRKGTSLNKAAIESLGKGLGVDRSPIVDNGLGVLAGTWDAERLEVFESAINAFDVIDDELWK